MDRASFPGSPNHQHKAMPSKSLPSIPPSLAKHPRPNLLAELERRRQLLPNYRASICFKAACMLIWRDVYSLVMQLRALDNCPALLDCSHTAISQYLEDAKGLLSLSMDRKFAVHCGDICRYQCTILGNVGFYHDAIKYYAAQLSSTVWRNLILMAIQLGHHLDAFSFALLSNQADKICYQFINSSRAWEASIVKGLAGVQTMELSLSGLFKLTPFNAELFALKLLAISPMLSKLAKDPFVHLLKDLAKSGPSMLKVGLLILLSSLLKPSLSLLPTDARLTIATVVCQTLNTYKYVATIEASLPPFSLSLFAKPEQYIYTLPQLISLLRAKAIEASLLLEIKINPESHTFSLASAMIKDPDNQAASFLPAKLNSHHGHNSRNAHNDYNGHRASWRDLKSEKERPTLADIENLVQQRNTLEAFQKAQLTTNLDASQLVNLDQGTFLVFDTNVWMNKSITRWFGYGRPEFVFVVSTIVMEELSKLEIVIEKATFAKSAKCLVTKYGNKLLKPSGEMSPISEKALSASSIRIEDKTFSGDDRILNSIVRMQEHVPIVNVVLISNDVNMRLKAQVLGIQTLSFMQLRKSTGNQD